MTKGQGPSAKQSPRTNRQCRNPRVETRRKSEGRNLIADDAVDCMRALVLEGWLPRRLDKKGLVERARPGCRLRCSAETLVAGAAAGRVWKGLVLNEGGGGVY